MSELETVFGAQIEELLRRYPWLRLTYTGEREAIRFFRFISRVAPVERDLVLSLTLRAVILQWGGHRCLSYVATDENFRLALSCVDKILQEDVLLKVVYKKFGDNVLSFGELVPKQYVIVGKGVTIEIDTCAEGEVVGIFLWSWAGAYSTRWEVKG